jgi:transposase-like protein
MVPPFCPNPRCPHHFDRPAQYHGYWKHFGSYETLVVGTVPRFRCLSCGRGFSERTFSIDYYTKRRLDLREMHRAVSQSESLSSIGRHLGCSVESVQNRLDRLARNAMAMHGQLLSELRLSEHLVADGFESFDRSQYFPNQINLLVGKQSQYLYGLTHATIRRKGRMSKHQKQVREQLEQAYRAPKNAVETSFARLLDAIPDLWDPATLPRLRLWTDEHYAYPLAVRRVPALAQAQAGRTFIHETWPSTAPRNVLNPLFPVNYYDRELRKDIAAFRRESTCYTRNTANGLARFMAHLVYHNYQKQYRVGQGRQTEHVHAEMAGILHERIAECLGWLYSARPFLSKQSLSPEARKIWRKEAVTPLKAGSSYLPKYAR